MAVNLYEKTKAKVARESGGPSINTAAAVRFALAFPNEYRVGMASLGFQMVYGMLNSLPNSSCERVFLPDTIDLDEHQRTRTEVFTLENLRPLSEFHAVGFSISFELDYINAVKILKLAKLPVLSTDRGDFDPIIIAGGPCATFNPEPLADIVDAFLIGDAEETLPRLVDALEDGLGKPRRMRSEALASVPGVYVPSLYDIEYDSNGAVSSVKANPPAPERVLRSVTRDLAPHPLSSVIHSEEAEFGDISLMEIARGCGRKCRFCLAGHITRPPRPRAIDKSHLVGNKRLGLVGAAVFDHPEALRICRAIVDSGGEFTVSSVRLETVTPELAAILAAGGQKTLTIAPEAATERLRVVINKHASEDQILSAIVAARDAGFNRVKLYFMIGLPTETNEDVQAIIDLARRLAGKFPAMQFQVSASSFVPKPWTPFQWHSMEQANELKKRYALLRSGISSIKNAQFGGESPRLAAVQGILARGDRKLGRMLVLASENGGDYSAALRKLNLDPADYIYRERSMDETLPWDHLDMRISKKYLLSEYRKALAGGVSTGCSVGTCGACGACE